jgi:nucleotide-binding universal stress UspA family protein
MTATCSTSAGSANTARTEAVLHDRSAAEEILEVAGSRKVAPWVVSAHEQGGRARWNFGRVADKAARHKPCPMVLARSAAEAAGTA